TIGLLMQRDKTEEEPNPLNLHRMGVSASVLRYVTTPDGMHHMVCQGNQRFRVERFTRERPFLVAQVQEIEESEDMQAPDTQARFLHLQAQANEALQLLPQTPSDLVAAVSSATSASALTDLVAAYIDA